jgi:hypothetical protein
MHGDHIGGLARDGKALFPKALVYVAEKKILDRNQLPGISVSYDTDPVMAAETRKKILQYVAANNIPIAGMRLVYPAVGTVKEDGAGGYALIPAK